MDELPNALAATDSPSGDGLNTYIVAKATKSSGITVALSGLGGDELFAGYPYFFKYLKLRTGLLPKLPPLLRKPFGMALAASPRSKYQRMGKLLSSEKLTLSETYPTFRQVMSETEAHNLYHNGSGTLAIKDLLFEKKAAMDAANPKVQEWENLMWKYQQALPSAKQGEKWILMNKIFEL